MWVSLEAAGLQLFPQPPLSPIFTTHCLAQFSAPFQTWDYKQTRCGRPCLPLTPSRKECSSLWFVSINLVSCLIFTFWHGNFISYPSLRVKQLLSPGYFWKLEILEVEAQIKHAGRVIPEALKCIWMEHNWSSFASSLPPTKREVGWCYGSWSEIHVLPTVLLLSPLCQLMPGSQNFQNIHPCFFFNSLIPRKAISLGKHFWEI